MFPQSLSKLIKRKKFKLLLLVMLMFVFFGVVGPYITPYPPRDVVSKRFQSPSLQHVMGTDNLGRDVFSRVIFGTRVSVIIAIGCVLVSLTIGLLIGAISGYYGGVFSSITSRLTDYTLALPRLVAIILVVALFGRNILFVVFVIALTMWPENARIVMSQVQSLRNQTFVESTRASGATDLYILFKRIIPKTLAPVMANAAYQMANALMLEASLSFVGLGDPSGISWGYIIYEGKLYLGVAWWIATLPGIPLTAISLIFVFLSDMIGEEISTKIKALVF